MRRLIVAVMAVLAVSSVAFADVAADMRAAEAKYREALAKPTRTVAERRAVLRLLDDADQALAVIGTAHPRAIGLRGEIERLAMRLAERNEAAEKGRPDPYPETPAPAPGVTPNTPALPAQPTPPITPPAAPVPEPGMTLARVVELVGLQNIGLAALLGALVVAAGLIGGRSSGGVVKCGTCQREIAKSARACPGCGAKGPGSLGFGCISAGLILLGLLACISPFWPLGVVLVGLGALNGIIRLAR